MHRRCFNYRSNENISSYVFLYTPDPWRNSKNGRTALSCLLIHSASLYLVSLATDIVLCYRGAGAQSLTFLLLIHILHKCNRVCFPMLGKCSVSSKDFMHFSYKGNQDHRNGSKPVTSGTPPTFVRGPARVPRGSVVSLPQHTAGRRRGLPQARAVG